ncbi:MAG: hypothetical protein QXW78_01290 [Candidatus Thermoplasmatota archaeon]
MEKEKLPKAPGYVIAIALLGLIFVIAALIAIFMSANKGWPLYYGGILLIIGLIFIFAGGALRRKAMQKGK